MIIIVWSNYDSVEIEKFGEGLDGTSAAEARLLELHNLEKSDEGDGITVDMVIRGNEVEYEVKEVASAIKIMSQL